MPAHRCHKTKEQLAKALRERNRKYYNQNREKLLSKKRAKYNIHRVKERKERKAKNDERKRQEWEELVHAEHTPKTSISLNSLQQVREVENRVNEYLGPGGSGTSYMERLFHEFLTYHEYQESNTSGESNTSPLDLPTKDPSPLELPSKVFGSMLDTLAKIGNAILNEYGSGKEWNECKRLTRRVQYLIQCVDDLEIVILKEENLGAEFLKGDLMFQRRFIAGWLDRTSAESYVRQLDIDLSDPPQPPIGYKPHFF